MSQTPAGPAVAVRITGLRKAYGRTPVLHGIDLAVEEGTITALLGPSGSGKTTLLRLIAGFERADAGTVELGQITADNGKRTVPPEKRRIGYVPQDGALFPHLSVRANIGFALSRAARRDGRVDQLLELTGLTGLAERHPHQLSGGQQQRVALARALAHNPAVVLLDEPFSALDTALRASVRAEFLAILRTTATTAILVTHDQDEALSTADRIAVLRDGIIAQHGTAQELYDTPNDPALAAFVGDANLLTVTFTADGSADAGPLGRLTLRGPAAAPGSGTVLIRPEQLALAGTATSAASGSPCPRHQPPPADRGREVPPAAAGESGVLEACVEACEYFGHDTMLTVRPRTLGHALPGMLRVRLPEGKRLPSGTIVRLTVRGPVTAWPTP